MNSTRAATIRLRSSFDGAVSLGRVQTPTLAIVARREEEIRAFKPEPYWLVDARFEPSGDASRSYGARFHAGAKPRIATEAEAQEIVRAVAGKTGEISKVEKRKQTEKAPMLYDLTSLQREANTRFGFSARRTLSAAQRLYEEHKALTYPRTNSRFLTSDMVEEIKPTAELVGHRPEYREAATYVTGLDLLPLGRVVDDAKVTDHHAIIPTRTEHPVEKMNDDDHRVYDLVARRFLAVFHPDAILENTRVETTVAGPRLPHPREGPAGARLAGGLPRRCRTPRGRRRPPIRRRCGGRARPRTTRSSTAASCRSWPRASRRGRSRRRAWRRRPSRRGATATRRCSGRWRRPAGSSTTRSSGRR